jgi:NDP-sugar pyrophosphorylase family protein
MVLCAGLGTRLGPLSQERPKPLLPVCDYPLVRYALSLLKGYKINEVVINLHHLGEQLEAELGDRDLAERVAANFEDFRALSARDRTNVRHLAAEMRTRAVIQVPYLDEDVHDLAGLMEVNRYLFASGTEERAQIAATA